MHQRKEKLAPEPVALPAFLEQNRILSPAQMASLLGLSLAHLRRMYRTGKFPKPLLIGGRKLGWPASVATEITSFSKEAA